MNKRPQFIYLYMALFVGLSLSFPVQIAFLYKLSFFDIKSVFHLLTDLNLFIMLGLVVGAFFIYQASEYSFFYFLFLLALIFVNNLWVGLKGQDFDLFITTSATLFFGLILMSLFNKNFIFLMQNPTLRFWKQAPRKVMKIPVSVSPWRGKNISLLSYDISASGIFLNSNNEIMNFKEGQQLHLKFNISHLTYLECDAKVVRNNLERKGRYPAGIGIKFDYLDIIIIKKGFILF